MMKILKNAGLISAAALLLAGCNTSYSNPFANPFGSSQPRPAAVSAQPVQPAPVQAAGGNRPSISINATPKRVQDTIIARAQRRGTTIVGANNSGVTLEAPMSASSEIVVQQCGPHQPGRAQRIYLETAPDGPGTVVAEDRFIIDGGTKTCQLQLTPGDIENGNKALTDLKKESETRRTASSTTAGSGPSRPRDPAGGLEPVSPGRPVQPLR
jgi:hypothetical protein